MNQSLQTKYAKSLGAQHNNSFDAMLGIIFLNWFVDLKVRGRPREHNRYAELLSHLCVQLSITMNLRVAASLTIIFVVMIGLGCHRKNESRTPQSDAASLRAKYEAEQRATLSAIIRDLYVDDRTSLLVVELADPCPAPQPTETPDPKVEEMRQQTEDGAFQGMPELARETIDDFHARAKECHPLAEKLDIPIQYVLVRPDDLEPLFPKGESDRAWSRFYAKYPGSSGIINFSNPGFNRDYTQAIVSTNRGCGGLCGAGFFLSLTKDHGVWKIKTKAPTWVS